MSAISAREVGAFSDVVWERRRAAWPSARSADPRPRAMQMNAFVQRHPAASYFLLAIALSWGGIVAIIGTGSLPASVAQAERLFVPVYLAMLVGPSVGGLVVTALTGGGAGLRAYRERLLVWRVDVGWYAVALLSAPIAIALTLLLLSAVSPGFVPAVSGRDLQIYDLTLGGILWIAAAAVLAIEGRAKHSWAPSAARP